MNVILMDCSPFGQQNRLVDQDLHLYACVLQYGIMITMKAGPLYIYILSNLKTVYSRTAKQQ